MPKDTQIVSGRVRMRTRSVGCYWSFMLQIVLVCHPLEKASLDLGIKGEPFYSDRHLGKRPEGMLREGRQKLQKVQ